MLYSSIILFFYLYSLILEFGNRYFGLQRYGLELNKQRILDYFFNQTYFCVILYA